MPRVPPQSPSELAAAIESILSNPVQASAMGQLGWERATTESSWERMVNRYSELYGSLLESQGPVPPV